METDPITDYVVNPRHYETLKQREIFRSAFVESAVTVGRWCRYIDYRLVAPAGKTDNKLTQDFVRKEPEKRREQFINLLDWIEANSWGHIFDLFTVLMRTDQYAEDDPPKFNHHDDTCCWLLRLKAGEFQFVKDQLSSKGMPPDLFIPKNERDRLTKA